MWPGGKVQKGVKCLFTACLLETANFSAFRETCEHKLYAFSGYILCGKDFLSFYDAKTSKDQDHHNRRQGL